MKRLLMLWILLVISSISLFANEVAYNNWSAVEVGYGQDHFGYGIALSSRTGFFGMSIGVGYLDGHFTFDFALKGYLGLSKVFDVFLEGGLGTIGIIYDGTESTIFSGIFGMGGVTIFFGSVFISGAAGYAYHKDYGKGPTINLSIGIVVGD